MLHYQPENWVHRFGRLSIVNILSNLMVPLAGLIDTAFLGHLQEVHHLAGVALATVLFNWIYWTFNFLRMGTTGTTAQAMGREDEDEVLLIFLRHGAIALGLGLMVWLFQVPLRELGFSILSATPEVKASGKDYYDALIWSAPATLLNLVLNGWFLGREQSGKVLILSLVNNGANVILNYLLIVQYGWDSMGAGCATAISQYLMVLTGLGIILQQRWLNRIGKVKGQIFEPAALKSAFNLNRDIMIRTFSVVCTFSTFTKLSATLGTVTLATNSLMMQVVTLAAYFIDGLAFATETLAGRFHGQGDHQRLIPLIRLAGGSSLCLGLIFAFIFASFPESLFGLLTSHSEVVEQIQTYSLWLIPVLGFGAIAYMLDGYFLGLTEGRILRKGMLTAVLMGFAPVAAIAYHLQDPQFLWLAMTAFMAGRAIVLATQVPKTLANSQT